jgi:hypothetical protein
LFDIIQPQFRSTAAGLMLMIAFLISAASPVLLGVLKPTTGLANGLSMLSLSYVLGALFLLLAIRLTFRKDYIGQG